MVLGAENLEVVGRGPKNINTLGVKRVRERGEVGVEC